MRNIFISLFLIAFTIIAGCGTKNDGSRPSQPHTQNQKPSSQPTEYNMEKVQASKSLDLTQYLLSRDTVHLAGVINAGRDRLDIHMDLKRTTKAVPSRDDYYYYSSLLGTTGEEAARYEGQYYYDRAKTAIKVEALYYESGYIAIVEYDYKNTFTGSFGGFVTGSSIIGMWQDKDGRPLYSYCMWLEGSNHQDTDTKKLNQALMGEYNRNNNNDLYGGYLRIPSAVDDRFYFRIEGNWRDHIGMVDGVGLFTDDSHTKAVFTNPADGLKIDFAFKDNTVEITANDLILQYAGVNVSMVGNFDKQVGK